MSAVHVDSILEGHILEDAAVPWGHQVAVMFQIVSVLALEGLAFLRGVAELLGMSPDVQLSCERWGHMDHTGAGCECCSSDRTGAYVHSLSLMPRGRFACSGRRRCIGICRGK